MVAIGLLAGAMQTGFVGRADAVLTSLTCGQAVTEDVVLAADVGPCPGRALIVARAQGLTIDLNGHRIIGPDNLTVVEGIFILSSEDITVRNGTVTGFGMGIQVVNSPRTTVTGMSIIGNRGGLVQGGGGIDHIGYGLRLEGSHDSVVRGNRVVGNGPVAALALHLAGEVLVEGNLVHGNAVRSLSSSVRPDVVTQQTRGIWINGSNLPDRPGAPPFRRHNNTVRYNHVSENGWHGITITGLTTNNLVWGNKVLRNGLDQPVDFRIVQFGDGIFVSALRNRVVQNSIFGNGGNGIHVELRQNEMTGNRAASNSQRPSVFPTFDLRDVVFDCAGNTWSGNVAPTFSHPCTVA